MEAVTAWQSKERNGKGGERDRDIRLSALLLAGKNLVYMSTLDW
jgi:hypothetical protein